MDALIALTRPAHRNANLARLLRNSGQTVVCLPALELESCISDGLCLPSPADFDLVVLVSSYAARLYTRLMQAQYGVSAWPSRTRLATVGEASAEPLYSAEYIPDPLIIHPERGRHGQDSEGLWQVLQPFLPELRRVLILRGPNGREWLGNRLERAGARVTRFSLYQRRAAVWTPDQAQTLVHALHAHRRTVLLLTSSQSVDAVAANMRRLGLEEAYRRQCRFVVIHERIASHLQSILDSSGLDAKPSITIAEPTDDAMHAALLKAVTAPDSL